MKLAHDGDVIKLRDQLLSVYPAKDFSVQVKNTQSLNYRVVGSNSFAQAIASQLKKIIQSSSHGKILLQELARLPKKIDFVEYATSHAAFHEGSIVVLHNAITLQGKELARFETEMGKMVRGSFYPEMALAHELYHVGQFQQETFFEPHCNLICTWTGGPWKLPKNVFEMNAIKYTNQIRLDRGFGYVRAYHTAFGGRKIDSYEKATERQREE